MLKESVSGVRGIVGDSLTPEVITRYCAAFAEFLPPGPVVIARDTRSSGGTISQLVCSILKLAGRATVYIGIQATPTAAVVTEKTDAAGGIIITASHNPAEWNALKFVDKHGLFLDKNAFENLQKAAKAEFKWASHKKIGIGKSLENAEDYHLKAILRLRWLDIEKIKKSRFSVAVDTNGGTGSIALIPLLEELGCRIICESCEPDGVFRHNPEPRPENLKALAKMIVENKADIGLATDPDADRLAIVSETGEAIGEEYTLAIGAAEVLAHRPGPIVVNLSTSAMVESLGRPVFRTSVGEINVTSKMLKIDSPVGGEGNGGLIVPECHPGRDGIMASAVILNRMARIGKKISELAAQFPKFYMIKEKIRSDKNPMDHIGIYEKAFKAIDIDTTDGIRLSLKDGWIHIRASNTEPVIRIIAESDVPEKARNLVNKAMEELKS